MSIVQPASEFRKDVRALIKTGDWEYAGASGSHGQLRHVESGLTVTYSAHGKQGPQAVRQFRKEVETIHPGVFGAGKAKKSRRPQSIRPVDQGDDVEALWDRRARLIAKLDAEAGTPKIGPLLAGIRDTEEKLSAAGETVEVYAEFRQRYIA